MLDYVRRLSYIYMYENDKKISNVGFVKMDGRDGIVKVIINIRMPYRNELRLLSVMVYNEEEEEIVPTVIGELRLEKGNGEYRGTIGSDLIANSIGISLQSNDNGEPLQFASYFKDIDVNILKINVQETVAKEENEPIYNIDIQAESLETENCYCEKQDFFEKLSRQYCKCRILGDEYECIRICDSDISYLPKECNGLINNSFFQKAKEFYKHILLIRHIDDDTCYIGVPGCYQRDDKNTAELFGFNRFLFSKQRRDDCANYGYWIANIDR